MHKIKRLSFTCTYHKSERIIKSNKKTGRKDKDFKPEEKKKSIVYWKKGKIKKRVLND